MSSFFLDIPYQRLHAGGLDFRQDVLLAERPAILRGAADPATAPDSAFARCAPLFGSHDAIASVALGPGFDLAAGTPEVASNAFMSCDRAHYADVPVATVADALRLIRTSTHKSLAAAAGGGSGGGGGYAADESTSVSYYMKLPLDASPKILAALRLEEFLVPRGGGGDTPSIEAPTWCEQPMLLRPGRCFGWLYVGQRGSSSPTHVDVMGSDAFLACFAGLKEWAMAHPFDKHLLMSADGTGAMADLFDIDHGRFPSARFARIAYFVQRPGDVVFTPGNAPHAVRNLEESISVTFNFLDAASGGPKSLHFLACTMKQKDAMKTHPATFTFRVFSAAARLEFRLRVPGWDAGLALPCDEWTMRTSPGLQMIHAAAEPLRRAVPRALAALRAVGATVSRAEHSVDYFFECDDDDDADGSVMRKLAAALASVEQTPCCSTRWPLQSHDELSSDGGVLAVGGVAADSRATRKGRGFLLNSGNLGPQIVFPELDSHFGRFAAFPPLCACLGYAWPFDEHLADTVPLSAEMRKSLANNFGLPLMWHYARYPIRLADAAEGDAAAAAAATATMGSPWCKTQLFYSSALVAGPVSLYPLTQDGTLLPRAPLTTATATSSSSSSSSSGATAHAASPHFVALAWNIDQMMQRVDLGALCPLHLLEFGVVLTERLVTRLYMNLALFADMVAAARSIGLAQMPDGASSCVDSGMEKIMALVMHLTARPGLIGFRYSHIFSAVREPDTLCLSGCAAGALLDPRISSGDHSTDSPSPVATMCQSLLDICRFVKGDDAPATASATADTMGTGAPSGPRFVKDEAQVFAEETAANSTEAFALAKRAVAVSAAASPDEAAKSRAHLLRFSGDVLAALDADLTLQRETVVGDGGGGGGGGGGADDGDADADAAMDNMRQFMRLGMVKAALQHYRGA